MPCGRLGARREIRVEGRQFAFSPSRIRMQQGDRVVFEFAAMDVAHGLYVDGYDIQTTAALLPLTGDLSPQARWDLIAYLWSTTTTPERLLTGQALYEKNCTACHDVQGTGRGPAWRYLKDEPQSFADATTMAGGTSWNYYAKIVRGGMGTGMPYFGKLFTEEQTWSLADYLWTFLFSYDTPKEKS